MLDAVILGGGPAGCAAAISLRQLRPSLKIAMVEATDFAEWRVGETLAPAAHELLRGLGCWEQFCEENFVESFGTCAAWGSNRLHENDFLFSGRGNGWHLDRNRFDAMLCRAAVEAGVQVLKAARFQDTQASSCGRKWFLTLTQNGKTQNLHARFVIDATGRRAAFATRQGAKQQVMDNLVGVAMMFQLPENAALDSRTLVEAQPDGWWYLSLLPEGKAVVAWMSDADLIRRDNLSNTDSFLPHLSRSSFTWNRVTTAKPQGAVRLWAAQSQCLNSLCGENWVATGDAAATFDPLSSAGILKALRWGKIAGFAAANYFAGLPFSEKYGALVQSEYASYLGTRRHFYSMENRWPESAFWSRRTN